MHIGRIGLGRLGSNMVRSLMNHQHECVVHLSECTGFVHHSGEGRWTVQAALEEAVPSEVLTAALYTRFRSRQEHSFAEKMLSAMRQKLGGHLEQPVAKPMEARK